jgi:pimeloyl-ACP methyl ester carboxylesterase
MKVFPNLLVAIGLLAFAAAQGDVGVMGAEKRTDSENGLDFVYPFPVHNYQFTSQLKNLEMAYMDISPIGESIGNIVLLHGKNFCGCTWNATIDVLLAAGYQVIVPDQVGFCKSTKPTSYQFTLEQLALNTNNLLHSLNVTNATIMGHSMGGMLSARYALMFPSQTYRLVMVDPLGLENWFALGTEPSSIPTQVDSGL